MLDELRVENLGIIRSAAIEPGPGLVAVTGETGAGKTLLLGALRLLRGDAAHSDRIGPHADDATVEGRFVLDEAEVVATRRLGVGRSRAYLDGAMVPAKALVERFAGVVEIVGQHEHVDLGREASLRRLIDGLLDDQGTTARSEYRVGFGHLASLEAERARLGGDDRALARELDLLRHQAAEISAARIEPGEDDDLGASLRRLRHAEEISEAIRSACDALDGDDRGADALRGALDAARSAAKLDPDLERFAVELQGLIAATEDVTAELRGVLGDIDLDPSALAAAEARQAILNDLKRKYGATIAEVSEFGDRASARAHEIEEALDRSETIGLDLVAARSEAIALGRELTKSRRSAAGILEARAVEGLRSLGLRDPHLHFAVEESEPTAHGADRVSLEFASDSSLTPGPVGRVASGGELSRLVLSVRVAAGVTDAPIVAFDEVDAGVGGSTALAMGEQLSALADAGQVLVVTHLPQVAAFADRHFVVERSGAAATVHAVSGTDRLAELARMLGGMEESARGRLHAEELLEHAGELRTR